MYVYHADSVLIEGCQVHDYVVPASLDRDAHGVYGHDWACKADCVNALSVRVSASGLQI